MAASDTDWVSKHPRALEDIKWLINKANDVAGGRNIAVHAPRSVGLGDGRYEIMPMASFGNRLANKLVGKQIWRRPILMSDILMVSVMTRPHHDLCGAGGACNCPCPSKGAFCRAPSPSEKSVNRSSA
jgi:hypothetical protein